jgi:hypothetical protein
MPPRIDTTFSPVSDTWASSTSSPVTTVRLGETKMSQVAKRLNMDLTALLDANPQISDPNNLMFGQDVRLPICQKPATLTEPAAKDPMADRSSSHIGDPMAKNVLQAGLMTTEPAKTEYAQKPSDDTEKFFAGFGEKTLEAYRKGKAAGAEANRELAEAHRIYKATGKIPQTKVPFSWIEIKEGKHMNRAERYDAMLKKQGKEYPMLEDIHNDNRDPEYLTKEEFQEEFWQREKKETQHCEDEYIRPGKIRKCKEKVYEKYGGEGYKAWRQDGYQKAFQQYQQVQQKIDGLKNSGALSTIGRGVGYVIAGEEGAEWGALVGSAGDLGLGGYAGVRARAQQSSYNGSAGLEVRRDATAAETAPPPPKNPEPLNGDGSIGGKPITQGYGKGGERLSPVWSTKQRGYGTKDCVAATCARSLREGPDNTDVKGRLRGTTNADEVLRRGGLSAELVHRMNGLSMAQARELFAENGKVLGDTKTRGIPTEKGDYAVVIYKDNVPKHMVYMRVTRSRGFYIDDPQMGVRFQGDVAKRYLDQRHEIYPITDK